MNAKLIYPGMSAPVTVEVQGEAEEPGYEGFFWITYPDDPTEEPRRVHKSRLTFEELKIVQHPRVWPNYIDRPER
jgi:hypothetical protein